MLWAMRRIEGLRSAWLRVALALGVGAVAAVVLSVPLGSAAPASGPQVTLSPSSLTFADQPVGSRSGAQAVAITNVGDAPLTISTFRINGPDAADFGGGGNCPVSPDSLPAGASCAYYVSFAPDSPGAKSATLAIGDDAPDSPQTVALNGNGLGGGSGTPGATVSPGSLSFGDDVVGVKTDARAVTLTNNGTAPLLISTFGISGPDAADFSQGANCPVSPDFLPVGSSCTLYVAFTPDSPGPKTATLTIGDNAPDTPETVALSGSGLGGGGGTAGATVSPGSIAFGDDVVGNKTDARAVTLVNTGTAPLVISTVHLNGPDAADFSQGTECPVSPDYLPPGGSCTTYVAFTPDSTGPKSATLAFGDNAPDSPQTVSLSGSGILAGAVSLSPSSLSFGDQLVGTRSDALGTTVTNIGAGPVAISTIQIAGLDAADFAQGADCPISPNVLLPGASCVIYVSFGPSSGGQRTASLVIGDNAPDSPQTVTLGGNGISTPQVTLGPGQLSFGSVTLGTTAPAETLTLSDTAGDRSHIGNIGITGAAAADFSETNNCPATLAVGSSCTLTVPFAPAAEGTRAATLTVSDDGVGGGQSASLVGAGVAPGTYLSDDFESGSLAQWDVLSSPGSSVALDSTNAHSGTTSVRITNTGDDESSRMYANLAGGGHSQTYTRFCFDVAPGLTGGMEIANGRAINAEYPLGIRRFEIIYDPVVHGLEAYFWNEALDRLELDAANGQVFPGGWHCVQLYLDESQNGHAEIWLDGTPEGSVSGDLSTPSPFDRMYLWNQPSAGTVWFDDIKVANAPISG